LEYTEGLENGVQVVSFSGQIRAESADEFDELSRAVLKQKPLALLCCFAQVSFINSAGLSLLIELVQSAGTAGIPVHFSGLTPHFIRIVEMLGLDSEIIFHKTMEEAMAAIV
jgi:anti-anti-sigma factor